MFTDGKRITERVRKHFTKQVNIGASVVAQWLGL